jgi:hypothetical protein
MLEVILQLVKINENNKVIILNSPSIFSVLGLVKKVQHKDEVIVDLADKLLNFLHK